jgi:hypothetical protein
MRNSTRWNRSEPNVLDAMVLAPALPYLGNQGVSNKENNPSPSRAKVDTGESFSESTRLNLSDPQTLGIWNLMKQADDPSHVSHLYRQYRDSKHCSVPKEHLRRMRDVMVSDMREQEKSSPSRKKQTQVGRNAPTWNSPQFHIRRGA